MAGPSIRVEKLAETFVASFRAYGESPEMEAWRLLRAWAAPKGLLRDSALHPIFGFNNPSPSRAQAAYGYELWISIERPNTEYPDPTVTFKKFDGGLFAVTSCRLVGPPGIGAMWRMLWDWAQAGPYRWRKAQELERLLNPDAPQEDMMIDLYLPVSATEFVPLKEETATGGDTDRG